MTTVPTSDLRPPTSSRLAAYLQLVRLPTVFTAMADVLMGAYVAGWWTRTLPEPFTVTAPAAWFPPEVSIVALLVAASSCMYLAGMVLNDYFDRAQDAVERPKRPIPSGRVAPATAAWLGGELLLLGIALAFTASFLGAGWRCGLVALALACCVLLYDAVLKRTPLGPLAMGACRTLNALLGMSIIPHSAWAAPHYLIAGGLGLYIAGVTWVARTEARRSHRGWLAFGVLVMWLGMALIAAFPFVKSPSIPGIVELTPVYENLAHARPGLWLTVWALFGVQAGYRVLRAILDPTPGRVQAAVKLGILSLVVFDAVVVYTVAGPGPAMCVLVLLVPTFVLSFWLYVT